MHPKRTSVKLPAALTCTALMSGAATVAAVYTAFLGPPAATPWAELATAFLILSSAFCLLISSAGCYSPPWVPAAEGATRAVEYDRSEPDMIEAVALMLWLASASDGTTVTALSDRLRARGYKVDPLEPAPYLPKLFARTPDTGYTFPDICASLDPSAADETDWAVGNVEVTITARKPDCRAACDIAQDAFALITQATGVGFGEPTGRRLGERPAVWWATGNGGVYIQRDRSKVTMHWMTTARLNNAIRDFDQTGLGWTGFAIDLAWRMAAMNNGDTIVWTAHGRAVKLRQAAETLTVLITDPTGGAEVTLDSEEVAALGSSPLWRPPAVGHPYWTIELPWPCFAPEALDTARAVSGALQGILRAHTYRDLAVADYNTLGRVRRLAADGYDPGGWWH